MSKVASINKNFKYIYVNFCGCGLIGPYKCEDF